MKMKLVCFLLIVFGLTPILYAQQGLIVSKAMVVSAREEASQIGVDIMKKGGNAFDAMVATELALAVAYPYAGNIAGGGFMVYRLNNGETGALDYREKAPLQASKNMYLDKNKEVIPNLSVNGALAVGVPGTIAGIFAVHQKFGKLSMQEIMQPVIALARKGIVVTAKQLKQIQTNQQDIIAVSGNQTLYAKTYKIGDTIKISSTRQYLRTHFKKRKRRILQRRNGTKISRFSATKRRYHFNG